MRTPCCITCGKTMSVAGVGVNVAFFAKATGDAKPYEVYHADIHECTGCGILVAAQFADRPHWRHFHPGEVPHVDFAIWEK